MNKLQFYSKKKLRLSNVLKCSISLKEELDIDVVIEQMKSFIKTKGKMQIGPLIQYTSRVLNEDNGISVEIVMMLQSDTFIHNVEAPYSMESVISVSDCMYCRYIGSEEKIKFAYDKIHLEAFENDIELEDCSYTIFVDRNEEDETIVADVFIPRKDAK